MIPPFKGEKGGAMKGKLTKIALVLLLMASSHREFTSNKSYQNTT